MIVDVRVCACGSGLRLMRCCQMDFSMIPPASASQPLLPAVQRAAQLHASGAVEEAERLCLETLELAPSQHDALSLLYRIRKAGGQENAAHVLLRRIVQLHPNTLWATHELTVALFGRGALAEAEIHARNAVRIAPENPQSHNLMGMIMTEANRPQIGEYHYRRVIELSRARDPIVLANLAWNLKNQGRMSEARTLYEESSTANPSVLQTWLGWARMEEADRDFARAAELLERADQLAPGNASISLSRAVLSGRTGAYSEALAALDLGPNGTGHGEAAGNGKSKLGPDELLEKGRLLDRMGRYDEAFEAFSEGKRLCREVSGLGYLGDHAQQLAGRLKGFFTENRLAILPRAGTRQDTAQPLFILGFPRSGTTLVEQTLSAHPRISAGDELPFVNEITEAMVRVLNSPLAYPEALAELWMGDRRHGLDELRDYYLERVRQLGIVEPEAAWFTDKMPLNETHLGLIALMFPRSPMIHVLRHPLDIVLSTFSNHLTHGFYCSYALETAARHYALVMDLIEHYRSQMTLRYLPVRYEDIVDDQEGAIRRILDFIGEPFDENCLAFHENRRYARTASYAQVTERLYDRSRYRYRRYLKQLEPAAAILAPVITRLGYPLD
ncbi:MAG TPA: sulfotransferase [Stellaceae bacterium]|jgi:tetratricopeptide (TPR) repeat protein|nr:sulfotransferase [Stellaceae bacterium]